MLPISERPDFTDARAIKSIALCRPVGSVNLSLIQQDISVVPWGEIEAEFTTEEKTAKHFHVINWIANLKRVINFTQLVPRLSVVQGSSTIQSVAYHDDSEHRIKKIVLKILSFHSIVTLDRTTSLSMIYCNLMSLAAKIKLPESVKFHFNKKTGESQEILRYEYFYNNIFVLYAALHLYLKSKDESFYTQSQYVVNESISVITKLEKDLPIDKELTGYINEYLFYMEIFKLALEEREEIFPLLLVPVQAPENLHCVFHPQIPNLLQPVCAMYNHSFTHFNGYLEKTLNELKLSNKKIKKSSFDEVFLILSRIKICSDELVKEYNECFKRISLIHRFFQSPDIMHPKVWEEMIVKVSNGWLQANVRTFYHAQNDRYSNILRLFSEEFNPKYSRLFKNSSVISQKISLQFNCYYRESNQQGINALQFWHANMEHVVDLSNKFIASLNSIPHVPSPYTTRLDDLFQCFMKSTSSAKNAADLEKRFSFVISGIRLETSIMTTRWQSARQMITYVNELERAIDLVMVELMEDETLPDIKNILLVCLNFRNLIKSGEWVPILLNKTGTKEDLSNEHLQKYFLNIINLFIKKIHKHEEVIFPNPPLTHSAKSLEYVSFLLQWMSEYDLNVNLVIQKIIALGEVNSSNMVEKLRLVMNEFMNLQSLVDRAPKEHYLSFISKDCSFSDLREGGDIKLIDEWRQLFIETRFVAFKDWLSPILAWYKDDCLSRKNSVQNQPRKTKKPSVKFEKVSAPALAAAPIFERSVAPAKPKLDLKKRSSLVVPPYWRELFEMQSLMGSLSDSRPARNIKKSLLALQETMEYLNKEGVRIEIVKSIYLSLASLAEQGLSLCILAHNSDAFLSHNFGSLLSQLPDSIELTENDKKTLEEFAFVNAVSGRYLARAHDSFTQLLSRVRLSVESKEDLDETRATLQTTSAAVLTIVSRLVKASIKKDKITPCEPSKWMIEQASSFVPPKSEKILSVDYPGALNAVEEMLEEMNNEQTLRLTNSSVEFDAVDLSDSEEIKRRKNISVMCSNDLKVGLKDLNSLLIKVSASPTYFELNQLLLTESVIWELILVKFFARHSVSHQEDSQKHILFYQADSKLPPYYLTHSLVDMATRLSSMVNSDLQARILQRVTLLEPILRINFRYHAENAGVFETLQQFHLISALRDHEFLPQQGHDILARHEVNAANSFIQNEILHPSMEGIKLASELLALISD